MGKPLSHATKHYGRTTPQSRPIPGSSQVPNSAGGYSYQVDQWEQLRRFLIIGTEGGTFYARESALTIDNAKNVMKCLKDNGVKTVHQAITVSQKGLAHKNDQALFVMALAIAHGDVATKRNVVMHLPDVARTGTHLLQFVNMATQMRGWGNLLKEAVRYWYQQLGARQMAFQVTKYQNRAGWSHLDVMRLARPLKLEDQDHKVLYDVVNGKYDTEYPETPTGAYLQAIASIRQSNAKKNKDVDALIATVQEHKLPWEVIPTDFLASPKVWEALLPNLPLTATIRNLGRMTGLGLFKQIKSTATNEVIRKLSDQEYIHRSRVHPMTVLFALRTYASGRGYRSTSEWSPNKDITDALDEAFYMAFQNVTPTEKTHMLALDVSGSMTWEGISGTNLTPREASAALAMVIERTEPHTMVKAFATRFSDFNISKKMRLDDVINKMNGMGFGGTDCSLPMVWATDNKIEVEAFVVLTDSETWAGRVHPPQALERYRQKMGIPAKLVVVGMASNGFTIADPNDPGSLDVVGFSADTPAAISKFVKGWEL